MLLCNRKCLIRLKGLNLCISYSFFNTRNWLKYMVMVYNFVMSTSLRSIEKLDDVLTIFFFNLSKELACETECSRGEDYRLMKLTIIDYNV